jgi:SRSO17 transposase
MVGRATDWRAELGRFLKPFVARLSHKARHRMCPLYVSGLIGPGDRKSIQPMAERLAVGDYDQLHHYIAAGVWDAKPVETELLVQADKLVGGSDAVFVIDDTAIAKKGAHSVGVAPQYASALGKTANCETLVSLTLARDAGIAAVSSRELDEQSSSVAASGCSSRGTDEAGDSAGRDFLGSARWGLRLRKSIYFGAIP